MRLEIESIPKAQWGISLANLLPQAEWNNLRKKVYKAAGYRCEYCEAIDLPLHCHEVWEFKYSTQRLVRFDCVCELTHNAVHFFGTTQRYKDKPAYIETVMKHLEEINGISRKQLLNYIEGRRGINKTRAQKSYKVVVGKWILSHR